jgi:hypothetical protein
MKPALRAACLVSLVAMGITGSAQGPSQPRPPRRVDVPTPDLAVLPLPYFDGAHAIWGSTGQDAQGHIWIGVTTGGISPNSAHLFEYVPGTGAFIDRGNVVAELERAGVLREGEGQSKIHSKIIPGPGNYLYFASMDEDGEHDDGSKLPAWGGHLWRMNLATHRWQHLLATKEALIAVNGAGRYIYALGYFGHILYQYDTATGKIARIEVGSVDGHISRNFLVDKRGHVYVPRLASATGPDDKNRVVRVGLVEFGPDLKELRQTPFQSDHYLTGNNPTETHGIVGLQMMPDGTIYFTTHVGYLYRVTPPSGSGPAVDTMPADVVGLGWFHPDGSAYPASLFTNAAGTTLSSVVQRSYKPFDWVTCDLAHTQCEVASLSIPGVSEQQQRKTLLYGSSTRDATGGHYVVGIGADYHPIVLRIQGGK